MSIFLITHGDRFFGPNPGHTEKGFKQLRRLVPAVPIDTSLFVIGTGKRFREIHETITETRPDLISVRQKSSPFCGSPDGLEADGNVVLVDGTLVDLKNDYIGLTSSCFNAWGFIGLLPFPSCALLCAGGELMIALGLKAISEQGQLYELDITTKTGWKIS